MVMGVRWVGVVVGDGKGSGRVASGHSLQGVRSPINPIPPPRYQRGASGHLFLHLRSTTAFSASVHARLEHKRGVQRGGVGGKETNILRAQGWGRGGGGARPPSPPPSFLTFLLIQRACAVCTSLIAVVLSRPVLQQSTTRLPRRLHTLDSQRDEAQRRRGPRRNQVQHHLSASKQTENHKSYMIIYHRTPPLVPRPAPSEIDKYNTIQYNTLTHSLLHSFTELTPS